VLIQYKAYLFLSFAKFNLDIGKKQLKKQSFRWRIFPNPLGSAEKVYVTAKMQNSYSSPHRYLSSSALTRDPESSNCLALM
jgi:hypothetical protein